MVCAHCLLTRQLWERLKMGVNTLSDLVDSSSGFLLFEQRLQLRFHLSIESRVSEQRQNAWQFCLQSQPQPLSEANCLRQVLAAGSSSHPVEMLPCKTWSPTWELFGAQKESCSNFFPSLLNQQLLQLRQHLHPFMPGLWQAHANDAAGVFFQIAASCCKHGQGQQSDLSALHGGLGPGCLAFATLDQCSSSRW